jgi:hypothetical protein
MFKKSVILSALALVLTIGVFGTINTTHAQDIVMADSPDVQVNAPADAQVEVQLIEQSGDDGEEIEPLLTQTRTQSRLHVLPDGECVGDGEQLQIRQQLHVNEANSEMRQQRLNLGDGTCNQDCLPLRQGGQGK